MDIVKSTGERAELVERALRILPRNFPFDLLSDRGVRLAAIDSLRRDDDVRKRLLVHRFGVAELSDKSDDYVWGVFDEATDMLKRNGLSRRMVPDSREIT